MQDITEELIGGLKPNERPTLKKSVDGLRGYLLIKGLFLQAKVTPNENPLSDLQNIQLILDYLNRYTNLPLYNFWRNLPAWKQAMVCKKMTLRDETHMRLIIRDRIEKDGVVYILLNGYATQAKQRKEIPLKARIGTVFGPLAALEAQALMLPFENLVEDYPTVVVIERGTIIRLKVSDFTRIIQPDYEEESTPRDEESVPDDPWTEIANNLPTYITFGNHVSKELKEAMLQYKRSGNIGRKVVLTKGDPAYIYILLTGEIRLVLSKEKKSKINCKGEDRKKIVVKSSKVPLMLLEPGSLFTIDDESFGIPVIEKNVSTKKKRVNMSIRIPPPPLDYQEDADEATDEVVAEDLRLEMVFDKQSQYLAIPNNLLKTFMRESPHESFMTALKNIAEFSESLADRMRSLDKWIHGAISVSTKSKEHVVVGADTSVSKPVSIAKYFKIRNAGDTTSLVTKDHLHGSYVYSAGSAMNTATAEEFSNLSFQAESTSSQNYGASPYFGDDGISGENIDDLNEYFRDDDEEEFDDEYSTVEE